MILFSTVLCVLVASVVSADKATFHNHTVYRVTPTNQEHLEVLNTLESSVDTLSFWLGPTSVNKHADVMVPPHLHSEFMELMNNKNIKSEIYVKDVQELIDNERPKVRPRAQFGWTDYYTLDEINAWVDSLVQKYPAVVTPLVAGISYEGRQIRGVKVSHRSGNPGVIIESTIHAREWITVATVTYILNTLLTSEDRVIKDLANSFDFYVFPVLNPDGYLFSHTTNRMWRKTRSPTSSTCYGADPNRNFDYHWMQIGASSNPCSETYGGASPFSEVETRSYAAYISSIADKFDVYLAFHSYSQLLLFPYGHSPERISNYDELMSLGREAADALAQNNGTRYTVGNIYNAIYPTSGVSMDWVRGVLHKRFAYTWELRDTGRYGFILPASQIIDTAKETLNSVVVILEYAKNALLHS